MKESFGSTFLYTIIFLFFAFVIGILAATLSYYKSYKVNSRILLAIDKYAGYNELSYAEIENYLKSIGYTVSTGSKECPDRNGLSAIDPTSFSYSDSQYLYCVYYHDNETGGEKGTNKKNKNNQYEYYSYSVVSYIYVDLPMVDAFKIPVYTKGERIYNFSDGQSQKGVSIS